MSEASCLVWTCLYRPYYAAAWIFADLTPPNGITAQVQLEIFVMLQDISRCRIDMIRKYCVANTTDSGYAVDHQGNL